MAESPYTKPVSADTEFVPADKTADKSLSRHALNVITAFGLVYFFWGSTYIAIRIGVEHIPAALMSGIRFLIAGILMLGWCLLTGKTIRLKRADALRLFLIGTLLLTGGNAVLVWSESYLPSGLAALIVAVVPLWVAIIEGPVLGGDRLSSRGWTGLLLGFSGLAVLLWPKITSTSVLERKQLFAGAILLLGSLSWAVGSIISRRSQLSVGLFAATGWEMTFAGALNLVLGFLHGEHPHADWSWPALSAIAYLITFGSLVGFTAYIWLLEHVPTPKVATYAYVNPVVAVFLGWLILHEHLDRFTLLGMMVIVAAVALVTSSKLSSGTSQAAQTVSPCEQTGD
jgi:drug/metabolite transporter (DMT)-like permease